MLDTMPYADLLAIYHAIAEKPVTRFDTRANGVRRTEALLEARGLTLAAAARMADVVLPDANSVHEEGSAAGTATLNALQGDDADPNQIEDDAGHESDLRGDDPGATFHVDSSIAPLVSAFVLELAKPERAPFVATFLRRLNGPGAGSAEMKRDRGMTPSQCKIVELCNRSEGATGKELAEGCGWPSIAARATCQKLANRFGYDLHESPKANGRGISFRMTASDTKRGLFLPGHPCRMRRLRPSKHPYATSLGETSERRTTRSGKFRSPRYPGSGSAPNE